MTTTLSFPTLPIPEFPFAVDNADEEEVSASSLTETPNPEEDEKTEEDDDLHQSFFDEDEMLSLILSKMEDRPGDEPSGKLEKAKSLASLLRRVSQLDERDSTMSKVLPLIERANSLIASVDPDPSSTDPEHFGTLQQAEKLLSQALDLISERFDRLEEMKRENAERLQEVREPSPDASSWKPLPTAVVELMAAGLQFYTVMIPVQSMVFFRRANVRIKIALRMQQAAAHVTLPEGWIVTFVEKLLRANTDMEECLGSRLFPSYERAMLDFFDGSEEKFLAFKAETHETYAIVQSLLSRNVPSAAELVLGDKFEKAEHEKRIRPYQQEAIKHYRICYQMRSDDVSVLQRLGALLFDTEQFSECVETLKEVRSLEEREPRHWVVWNNTDWEFGMSKCILALKVDDKTSAAEQQLKEGIEVLCRCLAVAKQHKGAEGIRGHSMYDCTRLISSLLHRCARLCSGEHEVLEYAQRSLRRMEWCVNELRLGRANHEASALEAWTDLLIERSQIHRLRQTPEESLSHLNWLIQQSSATMSDDQLKRVMEERCLCLCHQKLWDRGMRDANFLVQRFESDHIGSFLLSQILCEKRDYKAGIRSAEAALEKASTDEDRKTCFDNLLSSISSPLFHDEESLAEIREADTDDALSLSASHYSLTLPHLLSVTCGNCGKISPQKLKRCSRCQLIRYCSRECQRTDWPKPKKECRKWKDFNISEED